jgi:Putative phage abortive infection protein
MNPLKSFFKAHWIEVTVALIAIAALHLPLREDTFRGDHLDSHKAADYGQFLSGYAATIILIISVAALVIQLRNQIATNRRTSFESRFFELLGYHRDNVDEIGIGSDKKGRRVFVSLIREFREVLVLVDEACAEVAPDYPRPLRLDLAYMALYYGVGPNSTRVLKDCVTKHPEALVGQVIKRMEDKQSDYRNYTKKASDSRRGEEERGSWPNDASHLTRLSYCPFDGHQSRLGHYYRHLYQLIKYLDEYAPVGTAQDYADIVRAQLTNHEQALLCLNSLAPIGEAWIRLGYLTDYSLIKNIPASFFDKTTELNLQSEFPQIRFEFMHDKDSKLEPNRSPA